MTIEKTIQGYWRIYTLHNGHFVKMLYSGMTKKEALSQFKRHLKKIRGQLA